MNAILSSPGALTFSIIVLTLQIASVVFMIVLLFNFSCLHRRRIDVLSSYETPFIAVRTLRYRIFFLIYILLTTLLTAVSTILFFSLLKLL